MTVIPLALSIHHFVSSAGDDVGIVSLIGLVIVAALYFVQARRTAGVRKAIEHSSSRIPELERRVSDLGAEAYRTPGAGSQSRRGGNARALIVVLVTLGVAAVAAVVLIVGPGTSSTSARARNPASSAPARRRHLRAVVVTASSVTVAVLNGTTTNGLADRVSLRLGAAGFKIRKVTNAASQTQTTTVVGYAPGYENDALAVVKVLKLRSNSVQPVTAAAQATACPPITACSSPSVIVTAGSDLVTAVGSH